MTPAENDRWTADFSIDRCDEYFGELDEHESYDGTDDRTDSFFSSLRISARSDHLEESHECHGEERK